MLMIKPANPSQKKGLSKIALALISATVLCLQSCGGGSSDNDVPSGNVVPIETKITFPPDMSITKGSSVIVRGTTVDTENRVSSIKVNGVAVSSNNNFATWSANVMLAPGINELSVLTTDVNTNSVTALQQVKIKYQPAFFEGPKTMVLDSANDRLLVIDNPLSGNDSLIAVNLSTGEQTTISDNTTPNAVNPFVYPGPEALALDSARNRVLVLSSNQVIAVNLSTGARTILSGTNIPDSVNAFTGTRDIVIDSAANRALVADGGFGASIIAVNLDTGVRSVISSNSVPNALNPIAYPTSLALDSDNGEVLVTSSAGGIYSLMSVNLTTGIRTIISDKNTPNASNSLTFGSHIVIDSVNNRVLLADRRKAALFSIDMATGSRSVLLDKDTLTGDILFHSPIDLVLDSNNNRLLILDSVLKSVVSMDLSSGALMGISSANSPVAVKVAGGAGRIVFDATKDRVISTNTVGAKVSILTMDGKGGSRTLVTEEDASNVSYGGMAFDSANNRVYLDEGFTQSIHAIDLATGNHSILSGSSVPDKNNLFQTLSELALDSANNRIFACDITSAAIYSVDLATGARTIISDSSTPDTLNPLSQPFYLVYDGAGNRLLVLDRLLGAIFEVNVTTGARTILWDVNTPGAGIALVDPRAFAYDAGNNRVLVVDIALDAVIDINLANGQSIILSDNTTPDTANPFSRSEGVALDTLNNRLIVADSGAGALLAVNLTTGSRTILSNSSIAGGSFLSFFISLQRVELDSANNRVFLTAGSINQLASVDLSTGLATNISNSPLFATPRAIDVDTTTNSALVLNLGNRSVTSVNLTTGESAQLSADGAFSFPYDIAVSAANNEAYIVDNLSDKVYAMDLLTGISSELSGPTVPDTINVFTSAQSIAMDNAGQRALVVACCAGGPAIYTVDITTGSRTILSDNTTPNAINVFQSPGDIVVDNANNRALLIDKDRDAVMSVNLTTGARSIISDSNTPNANNPISTYKIESITLDSIRNRLLLVYASGIIAVDLTDGQRVYLLSR